jgi:hypothetical protein
MAVLAACLCTLTLFTPVAYADTDGTELQVTDQPEQLVVQLGIEWAGVEFELRTDAGVYPQPVVVSPEGVLAMELGGSKTYTLSALQSSVPVPEQDTGEAEPAPSEEPAAETPPEPVDTEPPAPADDPDPTEPASTDAEDGGNLIQGIPNLHLFLFAGGLIASVTGLIVMRVLKNRAASRYGDDDDYYDDDE